MRVQHEPNTMTIDTEISGGSVANRESMKEFIFIFKFSTAENKHKWREAFE